MEEDYFEEEKGTNMSDIEDNLDENIDGVDDNIISLSGMYKEWFLDYASMLFREGSPSNGRWF